ncbi:MAG: xanthine dehydrogenase family protein subunit M, partial [Halobacteriaceae archaeon]
MIDINRVDDLDYVSQRETRVEIGAMTRHRTIERHEELQHVLPMLPEAAEQIAGPSVRNRGTMGGSIAEADPAGNYPTALTALDADITITSTEGERTVSADDYFIAYMFTDLGPEELVKSVTISVDPFPPDRTGMAFTELKPAAQTFPTVSGAAAIRVDDADSERPTIEEARLA